MSRKPSDIESYDMKFQKTVRINKSREELYAFWHDFENLPRFMEHLEVVEMIDETRSHWVAKAPLGVKVEWDAEIVTDRVNEVISWKSIEGSQIEHTGSVRFDKSPDGGTDVKVELAYNPPAGAVGVAFARLFGDEPSQQIDHDLDRFKELMETGVEARY